MKSIQATTTQYKDSKCVLIRFDDIHHSDDKILDSEVLGEYILDDITNGLKYKIALYRKMLVIGYDNGDHITKEDCDDYVLDDLVTLVCTLYEVGGGLSHYSKK